MEPMGYRRPFQIPAARVGLSLISMIVFLLVSGPAPAAATGSPDGWSANRPLLFVIVRSGLPYGMVRCPAPGSSLLPDNYYYR